MFLLKFVSLRVHHESCFKQLQPIMQWVRQWADIALSAQNRLRLYYCV